MEKKSAGMQEKGSNKRPQRKLSEYGRQLAEKQKVKELYGLRERQFRRFFGIAAKSERASGEILLSMLERRLDNVLYRLKLASSRPQSRQMVVHGHVLVNGHKVYSPSYLVKIGDSIELAPISVQKEKFITQVVEKRLSTAARVPEWLELDKKARKGQVLRYPARADIQTPIEETLIVELYSK